ncbi:MULTISPECIES: hypothetical protein [unclassified Duganella]|uniref:hypothetical protein n=1 Tax=unclassified Duganella TaxID=2636909 RepID=UPI0006F85EB8|nr:MULTISPECIES: hypothetical protein [unclassified Duganella]KQV49839.1 hypothetical protein ASD07_29665 [Duganella sp. Root336D2]KRB84806.1 hypothetical protein ASE26_29615 [Duganella sp. Root198D2]
MNDVFYFSSSDIALDKVCKLLSEEFSYNLYLTENQDALQIDMSDSMRFQVQKMNINDDFGGPADLEVISRINARSCLCVSYHNVNLPELKVVLRTLLQSFGGWVGSDAEAFEPLYSLENIDSMPT